MQIIQRNKVALYHGDCLEVMKEIETESVDAVIIDPPYGINYQSSWRIDKAKRYSKITNDDNLSLATRKLLRAGLEVLAPDLIAKEEQKGEK